MHLQTYPASEGIKQEKFYPFSLGYTHTHTHTHKDIAVKECFINPSYYLYQKWFFSKTYYYTENTTGTSLVVQGLRLCPSKAGEKEMATYSSIPAGIIPGTEEPGGLQSIGSKVHEIRGVFNMHQILLV